MEEIKLQGIEGELKAVVFKGTIEITTITEMGNKGYSIIEPDQARELGEWLIKMSEK
jgi:hypothetical protein